MRGDETNVTNVRLSPGQPIDDLAAHQMETIARKGRGFVLDLAAGPREVLEELKAELYAATKGTEEEKLLQPIERAIEALGATSLEVKEALPAHDEWEPPAAYRDHTINDTDSFIAYAIRYGTQERSLVLFNTEKATLVIDEWRERGDRETVELPFITSPDWKAWASVLNRPLPHKELLQFLMRQEHNLTEGAVLASMQSMRVNSVINLESDIRDTGNQIGFTVKTNAGEELKNFPKKFDLTIPILEQDLDADRIDPITVRLNIVLPSDPKQSPTFTLYCSEWEQKHIARVKREGDAIRGGLAGWTVVHGVYCVRDRSLGGRD